MNAERPDNGYPDLAWQDARADEVVRFCKKTLGLNPSKAVGVLATALGFVIARSDNTWTDEDATAIAECARGAYEADRAGDIASSPNAR